MTLRALPSLALAVLLLALPATAQDQPPRTAPEWFKEARLRIAAGNYELAAEALEQFLAANPDDALLLKLEKDYGAPAFLRLRNVIKWSDNKDENEKAKKLVETIIKKYQDAGTRTFDNPARIQDLVQRLGSFREERLYAEGQLKLAGTAALPELLRVFRGTNKPELQATIVNLFTNVPIETMPGLVASLETLPDAERVLLLGAITRRTDVLKLLDTPETDFRPFLWYFAGTPDEKSTLRDTAASILRNLYGAAFDRTKPEAALTALAEPLAAGKAAYRVQDPNDKASGLVRVWTVDPTTKVLKSADVPRLAADEYYGLRSLRWALVRNPSYGPAQRLFTTFATERAVVRAKFGDLSKTEPAVYQMLSAAPTELVTELLGTALAEKRTALALGMLQALGDRASKDHTDHSAAVRALNYDDPRVQFAAAVALVRQPGPPTHGKTARVVQILRQALGADADGSGAGTRGRALIADIDPIRGENLAQMFRDAGYAAERYGTGRQLVARLNKASDYDLIVVDRHVVDPLLNDTVAQIAADLSAARRPLFVVASSDKPGVPPLEALLLRLSNLVAVTDTSFRELPIQRISDSQDKEVFALREQGILLIPTVFAVDPIRPVKDRDAEKALASRRRDSAFISPDESLKVLRLNRLQKLLETAELPLTRDLEERLALRLPQLVVASIAAEFDAAPDITPRTLTELEQLTRALVARRELNASVNVPHLGGLLTLIQKLESGLSAEQRKKLTAIQTGTQPARLALPTDYNRNVGLEEKLAAQLKRWKAARVLPEPFAAEYLKDDIELAIQNPAEKPRDPAERVASAKVAVELLRRMAVGELPGYDVRPAEPELRAALKNDALAEPAVEAVALLGSQASQDDLLNVALADSRPMPLRTKAADAAIRHIQKFGKMAGEATATQLAQTAPTVADLGLRAKLLVASQQLSGKAGEFGSALKNFPIQLPAPVVPPPLPKKPAEEPKM